MSQFNYSNPEAEGYTPVRRLRRTECFLLATAYHLEYPAHCTKDVIMPILVAAQEGGMFNDPPEDPDLLLPPGQRGKNQPRTLYPKWRGPKHKWSVMQDDEMVQGGFSSKEEAKAFIKDGVQLS